MMTALGKIMCAEKVLHLFDITATGKQVPLAELGLHDAPFTYAVAQDAPLLDLPTPVFLNRPAFAKVFPGGAVARYPHMLCAAEQCFLMGPFGYVVLPQGLLIRQSAVNLDGASVEYSLGHYKGQLPGTHIPWAAADAPVFSVNSYSSNNYFHFMTDVLGQLHWRDRAPAARAAKMIVSGYPPHADATMPFVGAAMQAARIDGANIQPYDGTLMFCRKVIFPKRDTGMTPWRAQHLRKMFGVEGRVRGTKRLYIARGPAPRRRVLNETAVEKLLAGYGFVSVNPGALSVPEQVALFAEAEMVAGPHGAGLTNAVFMAPGGAMIELTHTARVVWTFHEVAGAAGHSYACVVDDCLGDPEEPLFADFNVDLEALDAAVKASVAALR
jgi:capsular polysaccharide biosynthesis protein